MYKLNGSITLYSKDMYIHSYVHMSILIDHHSIVYSFTIYSSIDISFDFSSSCLFFNNNNIILYHTGVYVIGKSLKSLSHTEKKRKSYASKSNLLLLVDRSIDNRLWSYLSFEKKLHEWKNASRSSTFCSVSVYLLTSFLTWLMLEDDSGNITHINVK
jgi:hypothetical protein